MAVARIEGTDIACEVKLKSSFGSGRVSANDETDGSFVASTKSTRAKPADQVGVFEVELIGAAQLRVGATVIRLKPIDERPAQSVVLAPDIADAADQRRRVVEESERWKSWLSGRAH